MILGTAILLGFIARIYSMLEELLDDDQLEICKFLDIKYHSSTILDVSSPF